MSWPTESPVPTTPTKFADMEATPSAKETYPIGSTFCGFVTNVHNVVGLRFFVIAESAANARLLKKIHLNTQSPNGFKCMRLPPEGVIFGMQYGDSNVLRAVRLPTACFTTRNEILLPDIGRKELINENDAFMRMYHLPLELRKPPSMAVCCQLRGINDDVTIVPDMMQSILPGLLYRSLIFRVDGYIGAILKVQLLSIKFDILKTWNLKLERKENDLTYALKNVKLMQPHEFIKSKTYHVSAKKQLPIIYECGDLNKSKIIEDEHEETASNSSFGLAELFAEDEHIVKQSYAKPLSLLMSTPKSYAAQVDSSLSNNFSGLFKNEGFKRCDSPYPLLVDCESSYSSIEDRLNKVFFEDTNCDSTLLSLEENTVMLRSMENSFIRLRPILGFKIEHDLNSPVRPILGNRQHYYTKYENPMWKGWKSDSQPAIAILDKRSNRYQCEKFSTLIITPTYIGQLERFFGVIHEPNKCYNQHMWTDDEIDWSTRYNHGSQPLLFEIVLAKHCSDYNWYRAKVVEVLQNSEMVRVFFVDFGGECIVKLKNLARLDHQIAEMPFQAVLFRLHSLKDATTSINEHAYGVNLLRNRILKKTFYVYVMKCDRDELAVRFAEEPFNNVHNVLIRKGLMNNLFF